ncbi:MAG: GAP family protein [Coriobacteriales bacterium]|nr:GAP family protein [Coriobacteriales bacterium]
MAGDITQTFLRMLPFIVAGAFLPTWTSHVIIFFGTRRPLANAHAFIAGNATYRFILGLGVLYFFQAQQVSELLADLPAVPDWVRLGAGAAAAAAGTVVLVRHGTAPSAAPPKWVQRFEGFPPWLSFAWGFLGVASPGIQYVYFLSAVGIIAAAGLPVWASVMLLLVAVVLLQAMLEAPVVVYVWKREHADALFERFRGWLGRNGHRIGGVILLTLGIWLAASALP